MNRGNGMSLGWYAENPYEGSTGHRTYVVRQDRGDGMAYSGACVDCGWKGRTREGMSYFAHADAIEHAGHEGSP